MLRLTPNFICISSLTTADFILIYIGIVLLHPLTDSVSLLAYTFFDLAFINLWILFFKILVNCLATTPFCLLCVE